MKLCRLVPLVRAGISTVPTSMLCRVWSATTIGIDAVPVEIETNIVQGLPKYTVVGLPDVSVRESRDRVQAAIGNSGLDFPRGSITVNLAPADIRKEGAAFDLPIAMSLIGASGTEVDAQRLQRTVIIGELALDGHVRPVRGVLPVVMRAAEDLATAVLVPYDNAPEACLVKGIAVYGIRTLSQAVAYFVRSGDMPEPWRARADETLPLHVTDAGDYRDVRGQDAAKRALEVAAAGGHNVLMIGSPGAGKTMLARRLPTILPPLQDREALETTKIHSVGGRMNGAGLIRVRPFRAPHHTVSVAGLTGGGAVPRPGEISLAHNGVLFLDELPEFRRNVLENLRQPLEEGSITIRRSGITVTYPARFMLIASMNPCPCGYLADSVRECMCSPAMVYRYRSRISGPLLDRIDLHLPVHPVKPVHLGNALSSISSREMRERVCIARRRQQLRLKDSSASTNAQMTSAHARRWCRLDQEAAGLLRNAVQQIGLSARGYERIVRVARTIADLDAQTDQSIRARHVAEAIQYRSMDRVNLAYR